MYAKRIKLKKNLPRIKLYHSLHNRLMVTGSLAQLVESCTAITWAELLKAWLALTIG